MRVAALLFLLASPAAFTQTAAPPPTPAAAPAPFPGGPSTPLGQQVLAITSAPAAARAHWGIAIAALDGTPIYGLNEGEFFRPASNAKLFTTAAAMQLLRPAIRLTTSAIAGSDPPVNGVVRGNVVIYGVGDANISPRHIPYENSAQHKARLAAMNQGDENPIGKMLLLANGIAAKTKEIDGDIVGDDTMWPSEPYANDWSIDDAVWGYGAPVSALTINDNQLELTLTPGAKPGDAVSVKVSPEEPYYTFDVKATTVATDQPATVRIDRDPGSKVVRIRGSVAIGAAYSTELAIADPAEYAAMVLKTMLEVDGVKVTGVARAKHRLSDDTQEFSTESREPLPKLEQPGMFGGMMGGLPRGSLDSPTLAEDVKVTLKVSQNLHAELLLRRLGKAYGSDGSTAQGARVVRQFLLNAGLDGDDFVFYDGSGLSGHDLVTPRATAKLLAYATGQPWFAPWKASLPVGGEDGTLAGRFAKPPLKDHLFAKTGTLSEARALSGYVDCASGNTVIFSIMVDNHAPNTPADREAMDAIVAAIAANN
jgi:serine-type D-Ala-D-Ala carboxypeptidase/endopeptidase (penicillin-binding protein 4)